MSLDRSIWKPVSVLLLSVQASVTVVAVTSVTCRPDGAAGGVGAASVVAVAVALGSESPAALVATTR